MNIFPKAPSVEALRAKLGKAYAWVVLIVISCGGIASVLTSTNFTVAIPAVMRNFGIGLDVAQLAMSAYMAAMTIAMLPAAWMYERFGLRRCFMYSMCLMLVVSAIGTISPNFGFMVAVRMAQGVAAGIMGPMGTIVVMRLFPPEKQGLAWSVVGFTTVLAPAVGPAMGGILVDAYGWYSIFWINIPFCVLAVVAAYFLLPLAPPRTQRGPDWVGLVLLGIASLTLIAAATLLHSAGPVSWQVLSCVALCVTAVGIFLLHARRIDNPIVSPGIFRHQRVAMGAIVAFAYGAGVFGSTYLIPLFLQSVLGRSATDAGMALSPAGVTLAITMLLGGYWLDRGSPRLISILGLILFGVSCLSLWAFASSIDYTAVVIATVIGRIGLGILLPAMNLGALRGLEGSTMSQTTVFLQYLRLLGGSLGVAVIAVFVEWRSHQLAPAADAMLTAFGEGFLMMAIVIGISLFAAGRMHDDR